MTKLILSLGFFLTASLPALAQPAPVNPCQGAYLSMPAHKIARPQNACGQPQTVILKSAKSRLVNWSQPAHKIARANTSNGGSVVIPGLLPQTPATESWSIPAHQIANKRGVSLDQTVLGPQLHKLRQASAK